MIKEKELGKLNAPTPKNEIKYRPGSTFNWAEKKYARMLAYVDARYVQDKLDEIVGIGNWENRYSRDEKGILFCTITITFERKDGVVGTISKTDCGTESNIEKEKGRASDAFKRACVAWGIGRFLYRLDIQTLPTKDYKGRSYPYAPEKDKIIFDGDTLTKYINWKISNNK